MCWTKGENDDSSSQGETNNNIASPLLLPNELEHEVPSLSSSDGLGWVVLGTNGDDPDLTTRGSDDDSTSAKSSLKMFLIVFCLVTFGVTNTVSAKLQAIPMYNYPTFLNVFGNLLFVLVCFLYIIPVSYFGWWNNAIPAELWALPKRPFMIMGSLDSLATTMQIFAAVYLPGPLMVLLLQATIPISMVMSRLILGEQYRPRQYLGALIVLVGIFVVLEPVVTQRLQPKFVCEAFQMDEYCTVCETEKTKQGCLSHRLDDPTFVAWNSLRWNNSSSSISNTTTTTTDDDDQDDGTFVCKWIPSMESSSREDAMLLAVWSIMIILSCVPTTISSIYKQVIFSLHPTLDPIFLNGWVSLYQLFFSALLVVPSGMATTPTVEPREVPGHLWNGLKCFAGYGSINSGCHPDKMCAGRAAIFVIFSLFCSVFYNFCMLLVLKHGSTALLYLALTAMVPLGNLAFGLPFLPRQAQQPPSLEDLSDILGLLVILSGLVLYRFGAPPSTTTHSDVHPIVIETPTSSCCDQADDNPAPDERAVEGDYDHQDSLREPLLSHDI